MFLLLSVAATASCRAPEPAPVIGPDNVVAGALGGRTGAYLTVSDAASRVRIVLAGLPGLLYRISTPAGSGLAPRVTGRGGRISAALLPTGADGPDEVRIVLNREVRWDIRLPAGAGEQQLDLARGRITRLDLGASGLIELRLPYPTGTVPVTFLDDVGTVSVTAPVGFRLHPPVRPSARDRYAVRARSAVGSLVVR